MLDKDLISSVFSLVDHGLHVNRTAVQCQLTGSAWLQGQSSKEWGLLVRHKQQQSFEFAIIFFFDAILLGQVSGSSKSRNEVYVSVLQSALYLF